MTFCSHALFPCCAETRRPKCLPSILTSLDSDNPPAIPHPTPTHLYSPPAPFPTKKRRPKSTTLRPTTTPLPIPSHLLPTSTYQPTPTTRAISTKSPNPPPPPPPSTHPPPSAPPSLPHLTPTSEIHLISTSAKPTTHRVALAIGHVTFSTPAPLPLIRQAALKKGDVLAVARVAAVQAVKKTGEFVPLAHGGVGVEGCVVGVEVVGASSFPAENSTTSNLIWHGATGEEKEEEEKKVCSRRLLEEPIGMFGGVRISVEVETTAKTGVEMEALTGVVGAALTVVDMCKGVDKGCVVGGVRVVGKKGGRSGGWGIWREGEGEGGEGGKGDMGEVYGGLERVGSEDGEGDGYGGGEVGGEGTEKARMWRKWRPGYVVG